MVLESNRDLVLRRLAECLGRDRTKHQVAEVTSLGLVQMTRKRVGQGLLEVFSEPCEHCRGRGVIVSTDPVDERRPQRWRRGNGGGNGRGSRRRHRPFRWSRGHQGGRQPRGDVRGYGATKGAPAESVALRRRRGRRGRRTGRRRSRGRRGRGRAGEDRAAEDAAVLTGEPNVEPDPEALHTSEPAVEEPAAEPQEGASVEAPSTEAAGARSPAPSDAVEIVAALPETLPVGLRTESDDAVRRKRRPAAARPRRRRPAPGWARPSEPAPQSSYA